MVERGVNGRRAQQKAIARERRGFAGRVGFNEQSVDWQVLEII